MDEATEIWRRVTAPVLYVEAADSPTLKVIAGDVPSAEFKTRFAAFPDFREVLIMDAGHMLHHDQPEQVTALIEELCLQRQAAGQSRSRYAAPGGGRMQVSDRPNYRQ